MEGKGHRGGGFERHCLRHTHSSKGMNSECGVPAAQHFGVWVVGQGVGESSFPSSPDLLLYKFPSSGGFNFTAHIFSQQNPGMTR